ncbi:Zinc finger protein gli2 [Sparganum proliferum]
MYNDDSRSSWKAETPTCLPSQEAVAAAAEAFSAVRSLFANPYALPPAHLGFRPDSGPQSRGTGPHGESLGGCNSTELPPTPAQTGFRGPMFNPYPGHRSSGYAPGSNGTGYQRGGKKRSHSQSSVHDLLDIPSLTRSSQGSLNMIQAIHTSRSGVSSNGGSYGHLSAGKRI